MRRGSAPAAREAAWVAVALRTAAVGNMTVEAAKAWLKKSLAPKPAAEAQS